MKAKKRRGTREVLKVEVGSKYDPLSEENLEKKRQEYFARLLDPDTIREEALRIARDGGLMLCDQAMGKWRSGLCGTREAMPNMYDGNILRWEAIKRLIPELTAKIK